MKSDIINNLKDLKLESVDVQCACCTSKMTFITAEITPQILYSWGYYYWGKNLDGSYYVTCEKCTTDVEKKIGISKHEYSYLSGLPLQEQKTKKEEKQIEKPILYREI